MPEHLPLPDEPALGPASAPGPAPVGDHADGAAALEPSPPVTVVASGADKVAAEPAATEPKEAAPPGAAPPLAIPDLPPAACAARLAELFPALFTPGAAKPLKLRIQADIQQRAPGLFSKKSLSIFLHRHTTSTAYLRALVGAPHRTDLDGAPAGDIADEHRQAAATELDRRRALHDERRAAERDAQRKLQEAQRQAEPSPRARPPQPTPDPSARSPDTPRAGQARPRPPHSPQRPERPERPERAARPEHRVPRDPPRGEHAAPTLRVDEAVAPTTADDEARRARAALLRSFESSTLTRANFCVLKRMTEAQLDEQLAQARQEAPPREAPAPRAAAPMGALRPEPGDPRQRRAPRR